MHSSVAHFFFSGSFLKATACLMITFIVLSTPLQLLTSLTLIYKSDRRNLDTDTLPTAEILSGKNARVWVSMVLYLKK